MPRCLRGDLYLDNRIYALRSLTKMHKECPCCGQSYEPENWFYYGAMYVSYGFTILLVMPVMLALHFFFELHMLLIFAAIIVEVMLLYPLILRWSRNIWLNIFVKYDEEKHRQALISCPKE